MTNHPAADLFPMLPEAQLKHLADSIRENGLQHPIVTYQGMVLDGRNRLKACELAGVEPRFEEYAGDDPIGYAVSVNVDRRNLTDKERAQIAAKLVTAKAGQRRKGAVTIADAARMMRVKASHVSRLRNGVEAFARYNRRGNEKSKLGCASLRLGLTIEDLEQAAKEKARRAALADPATHEVLRVLTSEPPIDTSDFEPPERLQGQGTSGIAESFIRVVVPDSHGCYIDPVAAQVFLADVQSLAPRELVFLGDHVDVSGFYSAHQPDYIEDREYSYETDITSAEAFLDATQKRAPGASGVYIEGNHEAHVERWIARTIPHAKDAKAMLTLQAPDVRLRLKERGLRYIRRSERYDGLSVTGTVKLGKCFATHGFTASKFATAQHVARFGNNIIHGHTHRVQEHGTRTVDSDAIGGWCPGTLAMLQPLYQHTNPTEWRHGYGLQVVCKDGRFLHVNVPIVGAWSGLQALLGAMRPKGWTG